MSFACIRFQYGMPSSGHPPDIKIGSSSPSFPLLGMTCSFACFMAASAIRRPWYDFASARTCFLRASVFSYDGPISFAISDVISSSAVGCHSATRTLGFGNLRRRHFFGNNAAQFICLRFVGSHSISQFLFSPRRGSRNREPHISFYIVLFNTLARSIHFRDSHLRRRLAAFRESIIKEESAFVILWNACLRGHVLQQICMRDRTNDAYKKKSNQSCFCQTQRRRSNLKSKSIRVHP